MDGDLTNPIGELISKFRRVDRQAMSGPVTRYELAEAMLLLANLQLVGMNLNLAISRQNAEELEKSTKGLSSSLTEVVEAAIKVGGKPFVEVLMEGRGEPDEPAG